MSERRPLRVIDGDSFAHRAYHALPNTIVRRDGSAGGAIVGFANTLIKLYSAEQPWAVLVGWDTLDVPNHRQQVFPAYQGGRVFDAELLQQLDDLPQFVDACGLPMRRLLNLKLTIFSHRLHLVKKSWDAEP